MVPPFKKGGGRGDLLWTGDFIVSLDRLISDTREKPILLDCGEIARLKLRGD